MTLPIQEEFIKNLPESQVEFAGKYLADIFVEKKTRFTDLNDENLETISKLIQAVPTPLMKEAMLTYLDRATRSRVVNQLPIEEIHRLFSYHNDHGFLENIFKTLSQKEKKSVLKTVYSQNKALYAKLQRAEQPPQQQIEGVVIQKERVLEKIVEPKKQEVLDLLFNPHLSYEDAAKKGEGMFKHYEIEELDAFGQSIILAFSEYNVPMKDPATFLIHLKFYFFITSFLGHFPSLKKTIQPHIEALILSLRQLPNPEWIVKVLNQFPIDIIALVLKRLRHYEKIGNLEKRNTYCKLWNNIQSQIDRPEIGNVRFVVESYR